MRDVARVRPYASVPITGVVVIHKETHFVVVRDSHGIVCSVPA